MSVNTEIYNLLRGKQYEKVVLLCEDVINTAKSDADNDELTRAKTYLAMAYTRQFRYEKSMAIFNDNYEVIFELLNRRWNGKELIQTFLAYNKMERARHYLENYLKHQPDNAEALFLKAGLLVKEKQHVRAKEILNALVKSYPNHRDILYLIGTVCCESEDYSGALNAYERALAAGNNSALSGMMEVLFERKGTCDYLHCPNTCCKGIMLKGTDGRNISDAQSMERLVSADARNENWIFKETNDKGAWIFNCKYHLADNACANYENRPQTCRDYPGNLLVKRKGCTYRFVLREQTPAFTELTMLSAVLEILEQGGYSDAVKELARRNMPLIDHD